MEKTYQGIILAKKNIGEADRLYFIYTLEEGLVKAVGRGTRKTKAKLSAGLENFNLIQITIAKNRGMGNIVGVTIEKNFSLLKTNFYSLKLVFQASQLFREWVVSKEEDQKIFYLWKNFLGIINQTKDKEKKSNLIYLGFIFQILDLLGYRLEVRRCVICRNKLKNNQNYFSAQKGGIICSNCYPDVFNKIKISNNSIKLIRIFFSNKLETLLKLRINKDDIEELEKILNFFIKWI